MLNTLRDTQVPYDQPLAAHDMLLRFVGASLLSAAGPAARVPSRIGNEIPAVLGSTRPDGSSLNATLADGTLVPGSGSGSLNDPTLSGAGAGGDSKLSASGGLAESDGWWSSLSGGAVEGLAHASSAIVLVLVMAAALGAFLYVRKRTNGGGRRRGGGAGHGHKGWASLTPRGKQHARAQSLGRGGGHGMGGVEEEDEVLETGDDTGTTEEDGRRHYGVRPQRTRGDADAHGPEESHELDELMRSSHARSNQRIFDADEEDRQVVSGRHSRSLGGRRGELDEEAEVFGLGDEDEDEDVKEAGLGGDAAETDTIADRDGRRTWRGE